MAYWPDTGTGVDTQPARKPVQSPLRKYFTEGGLGQPPTVPGGDWFNQMTNEVLNVLEAAGIEPSKTDDTQLLAAIRRLSVESKGKPVTWSYFAGGADPTGQTSSKDAIVAALQYGGDIYFPDGQYFIPGEGDDTGGVFATIIKSLNVICSPGAKFFTDSLDNDFIRIEVPSNGIGLPVGGITVDWDGGFFDQRNQKNSTVVPFMAEYPPANPGSSATADSVSIRGFYTDGGVVKSGVKRATCRRVVTFAGEHWQSAGGDSGVFIGGALEQIIEWCYFKGNRDLGAYPSAHESGQLKCSVTVQNNVFDTCFHGAAAKRGFSKIDITKNTFVNCVRAAQSEFISVRNKNVGIYNNTFIGCGTNARVQQSDGGYIYGNVDESHGATLQNGLIEPIVGLKGYLIESSSDIVTGPNSATAENPAAAAVYPLQGQGLVVTGSSTGCLQRDNTFRGWRRLGSDETTGGKNRWKGNLCPDGTAKYVVFTDISNGSEERVADQAGNAPWLRTPLLCSPSGPTNPIIRSYDGSGASTAGMYFLGPDIGLSGPNVLIEGNLYPVTPNTTVLGAATSPLAGGFTQSAFAITSDETQKTGITAVLQSEDSQSKAEMDAVLDAWSEVSHFMYQLKDRVEKKGCDVARWHFGHVAQRIIEAFTKHGLDWAKYGIVGFDKWPAKPAVYDEGGVLISHAQEAGDRYTVVYVEALIVEAAFQRRNYQRLLQRVSALESAVAPK